MVRNLQQIKGTIENRHMRLINNQYIAGDIVDKRSDGTCLIYVSNKIGAVLCETETDINEILNEIDSLETCLNERRHI